MSPVMLMLLSACLNGASSDSGANAQHADSGGAAVPPEDISELMADVVSRHGIPSMVGAVIRGDRLVAIGASGERKAGSGVDVAVGDEFHLGSCSKAMTATLMGVLVQEGVLPWDMPLSSAFPDVELHPDYAGATLAMLLLHTGGAWSDLTAHGDVWSALWEEGDPAAQRAWMAEQMLSQAPEYIPGDSWAYSNAGYMVAAAAMEAATGQSWETLIAERIFTPLGMTSCGFGPPDDGSVSNPWGHTIDGQAVSPSSQYADNPPALGPAGTVHCNMEDWGRFASAHLDGARGESLWLEETIFNRLHAVGAQSYAMGWVVTDRSWSKGAAYSHAGSNGTFYSVVWLAPGLDTAWLVSTNHGDGQAATDDALNRLIKIYAE